MPKKTKGNAVHLGSLAQSGHGHAFDAVVRANPTVQFTATLGDGVNILGGHPNLTIVETVDEAADKLPARIAARGAQTIDRWVKERG